MDDSVKELIKTFEKFVVPEFRDDFKTVARNIYDHGKVAGAIDLLESQARALEEKHANDPRR